MITKIEKVTVFVNSQQEAKQFWTEKLGFTVTLEQQMGPAGVWLEVAPKGAATALVLYSKAAMEKQNPSMVAHPSIIFSADSIDAFWTELAGRGVLVEPVQNMPWGKTFIFRDQDGNRYSVRGQ